MRTIHAAALLCFLPMVSRALGSTDGEVSEGLSTGDWASIRAAYEAGRHRVFAVDGGHRARNPGQRWTTCFDGRGFTTTPDAGGWTWGLELASYGWGADRREVARPVSVSVSVEGGRVAYAWDERLSEWYANDDRGLEHGYTVGVRPEGAGGPLVIELGVRGELVPEISEDGRDVRFTDVNGGAVLTYSGLSVRDADDQAVAAAWEALPGGLRLRVDEQRARYPLSIDPIAQQAYLKASNTGSGDRFGISVSVSGDTVVVGANEEDSNAIGVNGDENNNSASWSGAAYVFVRSGTTWSQEAYLKASNTETVDQFGYSVSVSGDTVVVGAVGEDSNATGVNGDENNNLASWSGAAYVFVRNGTAWSQEAYLKASNTETADQFGYSVSVSGNTIIVGAAYEDSNATGVNGDQSSNLATGSGAAYVFLRSGTSWSQEAYLKASNTEANDLFGYSVSASGDTAVVGARNEASNATGVNGDQSNNLATNSGAAYVFARNGTTWSQEAYLKPSSTGTNDFFGRSVSVSSDLVVVGASGEDSNATGVNGEEGNHLATNSGAAYVFARAGRSWSQRAYLKASNTEASDIFGESVSVSGDNIVVGAPFEESNATGVNGNQSNNLASLSGAAYVFDLFASVVYCTAGTSASGCQAAISAAGTASASAPSGFSLVAAGVEGQKDGLFFFGTNGQQANPWGNSTSYQCVVPPVVRTNLLTGTGTIGLCDGALSLDMNVVWTNQPAKNPGAGAVVQAQLWYRDPFNTANNQKTSLSDAIEFSVAP